MKGYLGQTPVDVKDTKYKDYTPADWAIIHWFVCPFCGKKGYYQKYSGFVHNWYCKYCKSFGNKPKEDET